MGDAHSQSNLIDDDKLLHSALHVAYSHKNLSSEGPKDLGIVARSLASDQFNPLKAVNDFVSQNSNLFNQQSTSGGDADNFKFTEASVDEFQDIAKTVVKGLNALGQLHPFVGIAVAAFSLVVTMDLSRRDNDRKVLAVKGQMQELMLVFFELRSVRNTDVGNDGTSIADRLKNLVFQVATDIKKFGSACDVYMKKNLLLRTVQSSIYENRLASFAQRFADYRSALKLSLSLHTTIGVDAANTKLDDHGEMLKAINQKLDMVTIFRKLDTPRERDVQRLIDKHGGIKACVMNDEYLEELVTKSGESLSRFSNRSDASQRLKYLSNIRTRLLKEMQVDVDEAFDRNMVLFERQLEMQNKRLSDMIRQQSDHLILALDAGPHDRINDPDLRKLWKDMAWKGSVKARTFVLNLHDYYADQGNRMNVSLIEDEVFLSPSSATASLPPSPIGKHDHGWALKYINATYMQSILEAVDDDGTGLISIKEVNTFVGGCPPGWSLPEWFAFWAVGWQISITQYKSQIYDIVRAMSEILDYVLPSNRQGVDGYLSYAPFWRIELLLRSTKPVNPSMLLDNDLAHYTKMYTATEEKRLETNLEKFGYELDTTAKVSLVTGEGRIERFVYPLIYLLLKRHLRILILACKHVLDEQEFVTLRESLFSVLLTVDTRIQNIDAVLKRPHFDVQAALGNFACGLFQLSYGNIQRSPAENTFTWNNGGVMSAPSEVTTEDSIREMLANTPHDILKYGYRDGFQSTDYSEFEPHRRQHLGHPHPLEGTWTGHEKLLQGEDTITCLLRISILVSNDQDIYGKGENYAEAFEFSGSIRPSNPGGLSEYDFSFSLKDDEDGMQRSCHGKLNATTGLIVARWGDQEEEDDPENIAYEFFLTRTPPSLTRYRYTNNALAEGAARARWRFACTAVRHMVQQKLWSRRFLEERATERKQYVELSTRSLIVVMDLTPQKPLNAKEKEELDHLRQNLDPSEARLYQDLAEFEIQKLPWSGYFCDCCERSIAGARHLCITCMSDDLSDTIDLCSACTDRTPAKRGLVHDVSHAMIRVEQTLHDFHFSQVVENAKDTLKKAKDLFRVLEIHPDEDTNPDVEDQHKEVCACCGESVMPPCWACVMCTRDTFVCKACDAKRVPCLPDGPSPSHSLSHPLVCIRDTSLSGQSLTTEAQLSTLEQHLLTVERKVADGFTSSNAKLESRMAQLEARVEEQLNRLGKKFDALEAVLRQIEARTMALPVISSQGGEGDCKT